MTVQADTLYLPILSPVHVQVDSRALTRHHPPSRQHWRPRIYRVPDQTSTRRIAYSSCGAQINDAALGRFIDLYA
jgi:hypothetical protein